MTPAPAARKDSLDTVAIVAMLALTLAWGFNGVAAKVSNTGFSPVMLNFTRSSIAAVLVFGWCLVRGIPLFRRDGTLGAGIAVGLLFGLEFLLIFYAFEYTTVARNTLMVNTMPFWMLIGAHFLLGERMDAKKVAGLVLAFGGVAVVFSDKLSLPDSDALLGDILALLGGAVWASTTLVIRRTKLSTASPEKVLLYQLVVASLMMVPLMAVTGPLLRDLTTLSVSAVLFQAVFIVAISFLVWFWLVGRYPASGLSSFAFLTPAFGVLLGGLLLDEPLSPRLFLALGMIAVGLLVVNRPRRAVPAA